jgi:predicted ATPase
MQLKTVLIRFYKSFNFDYLRKFHPRGSKREWEDLEGMWYPYVEIPIDSTVTTVVGANESGKSHLLTAIEKGLGGKKIKRADFCRYSQFFSVEKGKRRWPDFGFEWVNLFSAEQTLIAEVCNLAGARSIDRFYVFRSQQNKLIVYLPVGNNYEKHELSETAAERLVQSLPRAFRINSDVALPDSVSIKALADVASTNDRGGFATLSRGERFDRLDTLLQVMTHPEWFATPQASTEHFQNISAAVAPLWSSASRTSSTSNSGKKAQKGLELVRDLICDVAKVDPDALRELYDALREGNEGHASGLIQKINDRLAASLNFPHWWIQDRKFQLVVAPREYDLVFTIRDRTNTEYSFSERSSGLKYFLSYYVQYLAHKPLGTQGEILLMDEPDAFLSSQAQQDLLKIFEAFSQPIDGKKPIQVIYVTHSPFLIDKNRAERIRVLDKGVSDEGTRVVKDAGKNHYEPLRSAFGAFVGETTFIGSTNLMVEGLADQILIAGAATHLMNKGESRLETLDLNRITIVPAGSASSIPYLVYLARGRDVEQPAVVVLLDSDSSGNDARKRLKRGGAYNKQLLRDQLTLQVGELKDETGMVLSRAGLVEIEDLVPLTLCAHAVRSYVREVWGDQPEILEQITVEAISSEIVDDKTVLDAIRKVTESISEEIGIEKVGFARNVIASVIKIASNLSTSTSEEKAALAAFEGNFKVLFRRINKMQRDAEREQSSERISDKVERLKRAFIQDHPAGALREHAHILFDDIDASLDDGIESDAIKNSLGRLRKDFEIDSEITHPINEYENFKTRLAAIQYAGLMAVQEESLKEISPANPNTSASSTASTPEAVLTNMDS